LQLVMKFDEKLITKSMKEFTISFVNEARFRPDRPMGNVARSLVEFIALAGFVGLLNDVRDSIPKCREWLRGAIDLREDFGTAPEFHIYRLNEALGVAEWLSGDAIDVGVWKAALRSELVAAYDEHAYLPAHMKGLRFDQFMPVALLAGEPGRATSEYETLVGTGAVKRGSAASPRKFGYAVASSWENLSEEREEIFAWGRKVLAKSLDGWISRGHYIDAATWVCLIYTVIGGQRDAAEALALALNDAKSASL
jgi:hypothetical protein